MKLDGTITVTLDNIISSFKYKKFDIGVISNQYHPTAAVEDYWSPIELNTSARKLSSVEPVKLVYITFPLKYNSLILQEYQLYEIVYSDLGQNQRRYPVEWLYSDMDGNRYRFNYKGDNTSDMPIHTHTRAFYDPYDAVDYLITLQQSKTDILSDEQRKDLTMYLSKLKEIKPECFL